MTQSKKPYNYDFLNSQELNEKEPDYEKAELDLLRDALSKDHTQRFEMMMQLIKIGIMIKNATIIHKSDSIINKI
jgi:hypothetical protein